LLLNAREQFCQVHGERSADEHVALRQPYFTDENAVGRRKEVLILATIGPSRSLAGRLISVRSVQSLPPPGLARLAGAARVLLV
jgi:hypothetical protein